MKVARIETSFIDVPGKISLMIYTAGCSCECPACHNKELWDFNIGTEYSIDNLRQIISTKKLCNFICLSGGNPNEQKDIIDVCKMLKNDIKLPICIYSGNLFEEIDENIKENINLLICGPFIGKTVQDINTNKTFYIKKDNKWNKVDNWDSLGKILGKIDE